VWSCAQGGASVLQIPASTIKPVRMDQQVSPAGWPSITMPCDGVSIDVDKSVWGESADTSTRAPVDGNGKITQPLVNGPPAANNVCPAGDSCPSVGGAVYSDNAGWSPQSEGPPIGSYSLVVPGCTDAQGAAAPTAWDELAWDADLPPNTTLTAHARSGAASLATDPSWTANPFTADATASPVCLQTALTPNVTPAMASAADGWLLVEFTLRTQSQNATPRLRSFQVSYHCP